MVEKEELGKLILFSDLEFMEKVGGGGFGEVWKGRWKSKKRIVAVKKFKELEKREVRQPLHTILESIVMTVRSFILQLHSNENRPLNDCYSPLQQEDSVRVVMWIMRISCLLISEYTVFQECICNLQSYCIMLLSARNLLFSTTI